jgi:hypothetical protein
LLGVLGLASVLGAEGGDEHGVIASRTDDVVVLLDEFPGFFIIAEWDLREEKEVGG